MTFVGAEEEIAVAPTDDACLGTKFLKTIVFEILQYTL
jgi:hypothetical protein